MANRFNSGQVSDWGHNVVTDAALTAPKSYSLIADSSKPNSVEWQAGRAVPALPAELSFSPGQFIAYGARSPITATTNQSARNASDAQTLHLWPFWSERPMKVKAILQRVHTLQSGLSCMVGIYTAPNWPTMNSTNGVDFTLLADYGTFDCGSTGSKYVAGSTTVHGLFFLGLYVPSTASAVRLNQAAALFNPFWTNSENSIQYFCFYGTTNYDSGLPSTVSLGPRGSNNNASSVYGMLGEP